MARLITLIVLLLLFPNFVLAVYDPRTVPNNKYGIHIADTNDVADTAELINSSGGDWGYVTIVIQENDRDPSKWQAIFNQMRRLHIIPIVRIATYPEGNAWAKPKEETIESWVNFLNALNWPIENRYVILYNEPNHAKEWGNSLDPEGYAYVLVHFARALHTASDDFFILPAGLDVSATLSSDSLDAAAFLTRMHAAQPDFLMLLDGWTSHSYPNPAFSGSPAAAGRGTLRSYLWEIQQLKNMGLAKDLPIFITETGWIHSEGVAHSTKLLSSQSVGANLQSASTFVWLDPDIIAVTPFVFNYQSLPFDHFSWKMLGTSNYYPHYYTYQSIQKTAGHPKQHHAFDLDASLFPDTLVASSSYTLSATFINRGQAIVGTNEGYELLLESELEDVQTVFDNISTFEPNESSKITLHLHTSPGEGEYLFKLSLVHKGEKYLLEEKTVTLIPPPSLLMRIALGWRTLPHANDSTVLIYDKDTLLHKFSGLTIQNGMVTVNGLTGIVPGNEYRIVVLVPGYLPRQKIYTISSTQTDISMPRLLPFDPNSDGTFTLADIIAAFHTKPNSLLRLFIGP